MCFNKVALEKYHRINKKAFMLESPFSKVGSATTNFTKKNGVSEVSLLLTLNIIHNLL